MSPQKCVWPFATQHVLLKSPFQATTKSQSITVLGFNSYLVGDSLYVGYNSHNLLPETHQHPHDIIGVSLNPATVLGSKTWVQTWTYYLENKGIAVRHSNATWYCSSITFSHRSIISNALLSSIEVLTLELRTEATKSVFQSLFKLLL